MTTHRDECDPRPTPFAAAMLRYVRERFEHDDYALCEDDGYRALLCSTEAAIRRVLSA